MNIRKLIESYEQERSSTAARPPTRAGSLRPYPRARPGTVGTGISLVPAKQRSLRIPRTSSLKIVKDERPVTIVLNVRRWHLPLNGSPLIPVYRSV